MNSLILAAHLLNPALSSGETRHLLIEKASNMNLENTSIRICVEMDCEDYAALGTFSISSVSKTRVISGQGGLSKKAAMKIITAELKALPAEVSVKVDYQQAR